MNDTLKIIAEFVDKASAGIKTASKSVTDYTNKLIASAKAQAKAIAGNLGFGDSAKKAGGAAGGLASSLRVLALAATAAYAAFTAFSDAIKFADRMDDLSDKTGITAANLKDLNYAATIGGSSLDGLVSAMTKLGKAADKSDEETSAQARTFDQLGVSATDASGKLKSSEQLFYDLADAFKGIEDGPEKSAAAFRLFGGEAKNLLPLLNRGSEGIRELKQESQELGNIAPDAYNEFAKSAGDLFDSLDKVTIVSRGFFTQLSTELVPLMTTLINQMIESSKQGGLLRDIMNGLAAVMSNLVVPAVKLLAIALNGFFVLLKTLGKSLGVLAYIMVQVFQGNFAEAKRAAGELLTVVGEGGQDMADFQKAIALTGHEAAKLTDSVDKPKKSITSLGKAAKDTKSALEEMVKGLRATVTSGGDEFLKQMIEANQKYNADIKKGLSPAREKQLLAEAMALIVQARALKEAAVEQEAYDAAKTSLADQEDQASILEYEATLVGKNADERAALIEKFKEEIALRKVVAGLGDTDVVRIAEETRAINERTAAAKKAADDVKVANDIFDNSLTQLQNSFSSRIQIALQLYEQGKISLADFTRYQSEQYDALLKKTEETADESTVFWQEAAKGIQGAMQSFFFDFMQGKLGNLADSFKKVIDQMVANALAANLGAALFGGSFEKTGKLGGLAASGLSYLGDLFGGFRANGGPVSAGKSYVVGEKQAEIFTPRTSGFILPSTNLPASGNGVTVVMDVKAIDTKDFLSRIKDSEREVAKIMNNAQRKWNIN